MKINGITQVSESQRAKAVEASTIEPSSPQAPDRVTVESTNQTQATISATKQSMSGGARAVRLDNLEAQVRSGGYRPDPARVAEQILADAVVDARIQAMFNR